MRAVVAHVRVAADTARLAVRVAGAQVVARVVARHLRAPTETWLVHFVGPVTAYEKTTHQLNPHRVKTNFGRLSKRKKK